jgi:O-antigen/teichoic acid export membrane protein
MLQPFLGTTVVGQFSVATTLAEWLWYIPTIAGNLLFAVVAADRGKTSAATVARVTRLTLAFSCVVAIVLMLGGRTLVAFLYGAQYAMAGIIFVALVPGMTAIAVHLVIDSYFAGIGFPLNSVWAAALSLCAKVALNFVLVPAFGALGAAWATCIVYIALLGYKILWFRSTTSLPWRSILLADRADLSDGLNEVRSWVRRRFEPESSPVPRRAA